MIHPGIRDDWPTIAKWAQGDTVDLDRLASELVAAANAARRTAAAGHEQTGQTTTTEVA